MRWIVRRGWKSKFARLIQDLRCGISCPLCRRSVPSAIYHWIRAATTPRPAHAVIIQGLARERGYRLTMDEIYGQVYIGAFPRHQRERMNFNPRTANDVAWVEK